MNVASQVRRAVEQDRAMAAMLAHGIVNLRAAARHLQAEGLVAAGPADAVVSALRRMRGELPHGGAASMLAGARIHVTRPVASLTVRHSAESGGRFEPDLLAGLEPRWQVVSPQGLRLVVHEDRLKGREARILAVPEIQMQRGLAEVALVLAPEARRTPGILAVACQQLALANINIVETVDGFGQHTFLVAQEQASDAVRSLHPETAGAAPPGSWPHGQGQARRKAPP